MKTISMCWRRFPRAMAAQSPICLPLACRYGTDNAHYTKQCGNSESSMRQEWGFVGSASSGGDGGLPSGVIQTLVHARIPSPPSHGTPRPATGRRYGGLEHRHIQLRNKSPGIAFKAASYQAESEQMNLKLALGVALGLACIPMAAEARSDLRLYGAVPVESSPQLMQAYNRALERCLPEAGLAEAGAIAEASLPAVRLRGCLYRKGFFYRGVYAYPVAMSVYRIR